MNRERDDGALSAEETRKHFDEAAATWDEKPRRTERARRVAAMLLEHAAPGPEATVLDYGCGTGTFAFELAPSVGRVVAADFAPGMLDQVRHKAEALGIENVETLDLDLARDEPPRLRAAALSALMCLHHIGPREAFERVLAGFATILAPGGTLFLADLEATNTGDAGESEAEPALPVGHGGLPLAWLEARLNAHGFGAARIERVPQGFAPEATGTPGAQPGFVLSARGGD
jgi:ubiquinone/menaquinone biosynthesis C-methylase UbiE